MIIYIHPIADTKTFEFGTHSHTHTSTIILCMCVRAHMHTNIHIVHTLSGALCNSQCPDELQLGVLTSNNWHTGAKIFIALLIISLAIICVIVKTWFSCWLIRLEKKQRDYIKSLDEKVECSNQPTLQVQICSFLELLLQ